MALGLMVKDLYLKIVKMSLSIQFDHWFKFQIIDKAVPSLIKVVKAVFKISEQRMLKDITPLIEDASIEDQTVKNMFAEACFEIFKNYEMIFTNISAKGKTFFNLFFQV